VAERSTKKLKVENVVLKLLFQTFLIPDILLFCNDDIGPD